MNKLSILLLCLISVTLFSCSNEEDPKLPEIEPGKFYGDIGRVGYNLINDKWNQRVKTTHFDSNNIQFQFSADWGPSNINGTISDLNQILTVNLVDPLNTSSFPFFETYKGAKIYNENWISLDWYEKWGDKKLKTSIPRLKISNLSKRKFYPLITGN